MRAEQNDWENEEVVGINKLPYHSTLILPSSRADALSIIHISDHTRRTPI